MPAAGWSTAVFDDTNLIMIVWAGGDRQWSNQHGSIYYDRTDSWEPMSTTGAPVGRNDHTAVWTGSQ